MLDLELLARDRRQTISTALSEDLAGSNIDNDITAALIPADKTYHTKVITREAAVICGRDWVNETFTQVDPSVVVTWHVNDGDQVEANTTLFEVQGNARSILTGERTALNFLQLLSGTATVCQRYANVVDDTNVKLLDTRKTIPGLRTAQKYAVTCGGCHNHRIGLYDAYLIKENHIAACGSIAAAVATAKQRHPDKPIEVEVENLAELQQAIDAGAHRIMLDNFSLEDMRSAVRNKPASTELEASGNVTLETLRAIAETGVDYISIGALTKDCKAIDLSMRFVGERDSTVKDYFLSQSNSKSKKKPRL